MGRKKKEELTEEQKRQLAEDPAEALLDQIQIEEPQSGLLLDFPLPEKNDIEGPQEDVRPLMSEPEWSDYVMKHFTPDELVNGHPKVDGLRRVTELLLGPVVQGMVRVIEGPKQINNWTAVCEYTVTIESVYESDYGKIRVFNSAADAGPHNSDKQFSKFPTALAETRARGRAYREALRLNKCAAEELVKVPVDEAEERGVISKGQTTFIDMMCQRMNLDAIGFINYWIKEKVKKKYDRIRDIESVHVSNMNEQLSNWQRNIEEVPEGLFGYKSGWNESF